MPHPVTDLHAIEIEISTACNWSCNFCPVSVTPKPRATMSMELFRKILDRAKAVPSIHTVSINQYNEPTLDKHFMERLRLINEYGFRTLLHTNGSGLTRERVRTIIDNDLVRHMTFNFPSLDPVEFARLTGGATNFEHVRDMIDLVRSSGQPCDIRVNGTFAEMSRNYEAIVTRWPGIIKSFPVTNDRIGLMTNEYGMRVDIKDARLTGCNLPDQWLYASVHGDLFLCCEDYNQRSVYGSLLTHSIEELRTGPAFTKLMAQVNGQEDAPEDFLCRKCFYMACSKAAKESLPSEAAK